MAAPAPRRACFKLLELARDRGVKISFDPNLRRHLWKDHYLMKRLALKTAALSALVKLNAEELSYLTGKEGVEEGAKVLQALGPEVVVVTRGPEGAFYVGPEGAWAVGGHSPAVVDTMGAGDSFAAGLLAALGRVRPWPPDRERLEAAVRFANAAGALACPPAGALTARTGRGVVEEFLSRGKRRGMS
jgi:fructokinase